MSMGSIFEHDTSTVGTTIGIVVCLVAVIGSQFLGWEWGESGQIAPFVIGAAAVVAAGVLAYQRYRN